MQATEGDSQARRWRTHPALARFTFRSSAVFLNSASASSMLRPPFGLDSAAGMLDDRTLCCCCVEGRRIPKKQSLYSSRREATTDGEDAGQNAGAKGAFEFVATD